LAADDPEYLGGARHFRVPRFAAREQAAHFVDALSEGRADAVVHPGETEIFRVGDAQAA
jgi:hypothetical protein